MLKGFSMTKINVFLIKYYLYLNYSLQIFVLDNS